MVFVKKEDGKEKKTTEIGSVVGEKWCSYTGVGPRKRRAKRTSVRVEEKK